MIKAARKPGKSADATLDLARQVLEIEAQAVRALIERMVAVVTGAGTGIGAATVRRLAARGARYVALQVDADNQPARHLYEKIGFLPLGEVTQYVRPSLRSQPLRADPPPDFARPARYADRNTLWALYRRALPDALSFAEAVDADVYRLGLRWSLVNLLNGNAEAWHVPNRGADGALHAAVRTRVNYEGAYHHLELLIEPPCDADTGRALAASALQRFAMFIPKPIFVAQSHSSPVARAALCENGFAPRRTLIHMRLSL